MGVTLSPAELREALGGIDIYLLDQLLRGRIESHHRILEAGCGGGRNLVYFLQAGFDVRGLDADPSAIAEVSRLARSLAPALPEENFRAERLDASSFPAETADVVISSAVLHFASDDADFQAMLLGSWRLLAPGGLFFCRLASSIGIEAAVPAIGPGHRRTRLPDGSERYLVDAPMLIELTARLGARLLDPLKTTVVHGQRAMTTWVLRKAPGMA